ncbi:MAG: hydroxyethylthiazole kinase [Clostridia bacterium]|jgi:hydroxyethylthiazole kinase|nr:hydroxyethylthiazole kinase [Clostridia bacterium]
MNLPENIIKNLRNKTPLVHCITNYVTVNDCANSLLSIGGSPIMADDEAEVEEIISICDALVINIGTLNQRTIKSMLKAGKKANELGKKVVLDPVGVGASSLRTNTAMELLANIKFNAVRGNISEIKTLAIGAGATHGVDASAADAINKNNLVNTVELAQSLAKKTGAVIAITGAIDVVANEEKSRQIYNGHPMMSKITGTGCMCSAILGAFLAASEDGFAATTAAIASMGLSGEKAWQKVEAEGLGTGSLRTYLINELSLMTDEKLLAYAKIKA